MSLVEDRFLIEQTLAASLVEDPPATALPDTLDERVLKGVALLDEKVPGWAHRINLEYFDLGSSARCVLGQVYQAETTPGLFGYGVGCARLGISGREYGFAGDSDLDLDLDDDWDLLQRDWETVIFARQNQPKEKTWL